MLASVERGLPDEARREQVALALELRPCVVQVGLRLAQTLLGHRQLHLAQLPQARLRLRHVELGLAQRRLEFRAVEFDQNLAGVHRLPSATGTALTVPVIWAPMSTRCGASTRPLATTL